MSWKNIEDAYPLSPMQQGMLFHSLYAPESGVYFGQIICTLHGNLNVSAFEQAWQRVVDRHPILRTAFVWENLEKPLQVVGQRVKLPLEQQDWQGLSPEKYKVKLEEFLECDRQQNFDLAKAPLMHLTLIQLAQDEYQFIWSHHHLLLDGWSASLLLKEIVSFYEAFCQGRELELPSLRPYRDYISWLQQQDLSKSEEFWRQRLQGFTAPTPLGVDREATEATAIYQEQEIQLSPATTAALQSLARQHQLTLNTLIQGAWALLLSRYSGEEDVVFGATSSGRPASLTGAESMIGLFINTLPVRVQISPEECLLPWLKRLQGQQAEALQYEYSPLLEVQGWSEVPRGMSLFESLVVFENYPVDRSLQQLSGTLDVQNLHSVEKTNYPLTLLVLPGSELLLRMSYDSCRLETDAMTRMLGHLSTLLDGIVANPNRCLKDLPLLSDRECQQLLLEWNQTQADYPQDQCLHQLFEAQVERTPDAIAVEFAGEQLTYRELNQRANQLAHHLQKLGVGSEVLVGIGVERSLEMVVGLLAILKAGGAYVPLDPAHPQERLAFMLEDAQVSMLLTQQRLVEGFSDYRGQIVCLDADSDTLAKRGASAHIAQAPSHKPANLSTPDNLAYVLYTSGSTGKPKGVQIPHRAVVNFLSSMRQTPGLTDQDILLAVTTITFDIAVLELFLPLVVGARVVIASREVAADGTQLLKVLNDSGATVMQATPATWRSLLISGWHNGAGGVISALPSPSSLPSLTKCHSPQLKILCGGEALDLDLAQSLQERGASVWNLYGPTETAIWSAIYPVDREDESIPIGRPIANTQIYLLDRYQQPVPVGVCGELYIGGAGLARGYLNRPELTAERFITNPFKQEWERGRVGEGEKGGIVPLSSERLYRTGDLARYLPNGDIEYLGRIDHQVKIRGFRIELGEVEAVLSQHPEVQQAVVMAREDHLSDRRLVAYLVPKPPHLASLDRDKSGHKPPNSLVDNQQIFPLFQAPRDEPEENPKSKIQNPKSIDDLRRFLRTQLPEYMVPSAFVLLEALPLTPNGKVDRRALPAPDTSRPELESPFVAPRTPTEEKLATLWAQVLHLDQVSVRDNFFELGGHSLFATQLISKLRQVFEVELPLRALFEAPTIAELSEKIEQASSTGPREPAIVPVARSARRVKLSSLRGELKP